MARLRIAEGSCWFCLFRLSPARASLDSHGKQDAVTKGFAQDMLLASRLMGSELLLASGLAPLWHSARGTSHHCSKAQANKPKQHPEAS